jgi:hypothetical protein
MFLTGSRTYTGQGTLKLPGDGVDRYPPSTERCHRASKSDACEPVPQLRHPPRPPEHTSLYRHSFHARHEPLIFCKWLHRRFGPKSAHLPRNHRECLRARAPLPHSACRLNRLSTIECFVYRHPPMRFTSGLRKFCTQLRGK